MANTGTLEILLVEAQGLKDRDKCILGCLNVINPWKRVSKPYAHIVYGNQEHTSSVGKGKGKKRAWNQKFVFDVKYPAGEEGEDHMYKIVIRLMDKHKFSDHEFVGETTIYVKEIISLGVEKGKFQVEPRQYRVVQSDKTYSGEISISLAFCKVEEGKGEESEDLTEIKCITG